MIHRSRTAPEVGTRLLEGGVAGIAVLSLVAGMVAGLVPGRAFAIGATEPRAYQNLPLGYNYGELNYLTLDGNISLDQALAIKGADFKVTNWQLRYFKYYSAGGQIGRWGVEIPWARVSGDLRGTPITGSNSGLGDPVIKVTKTFRGAPALSRPEFLGYEQDTIIAGQLAIAVPLGEYDRNRVLNIGTNRWTFKPELAFSKKVKKWTYEVYGNVQFFTDNSDYLGSSRLKQDPLWGLEAHIVRDFEQGRWASLDVLYALGGETSVDGFDQDNKQDDFVVGGNLCVPLSMSDMLTITYQTNSRSKEGSPDFDAWIITFTHLW
jgi:hypothetical protein